MGSGGNTLNVVFSVSERLVAQAAQFAVFIVAARILGPAEFGVFALASAVAFLFFRAAEAGWAPFIMSHDGDVSVPLQVLFIAIVTGILVGVFGALTAVGIDAVFGLEAGLLKLMLLFSIWVVIANAASAQTGILIWLGRIRASSLCEISGEVTALVVAVVALKSGEGVLALAYGRLTAQSVTLLSSLAVTRRLPMLGMSAQVRRELWAFSSQIFGARMLVQMRLHFVTLIIGSYLGPSAAGLFRAAERLVGALTELIWVPGQIMAWSTLRRARDEGDSDPRSQQSRINVQLARLLFALIMLGAPLLLWTIIMREEIVLGLLGSEWALCAPLVAVLAIGRLLLFVGITTEPLLSITGQARRMPGFMASLFCVSIVLTLVCAPYGLMPLAWSQVAISSISLIATIRLFSKHSGIHWKEVGKPLQGTIIPLVCGVVTIVILKEYFFTTPWPDLLKAVLFGLSGGLIFGGVTYALSAGMRSKFVLMKRGLG